MHPTHGSRNNTPPPARGLLYTTPLSATFSGTMNKKNTSFGKNNFSKTVEANQSRQHPTLPKLTSVDVDKRELEVPNPKITGESSKQLLQMKDSSVAEPNFVSTSEIPNGEEIREEKSNHNKFNTSSGPRELNRTFNSTFNKTTSSRLLSQSQRGVASASPPPLVSTLRQYLDREAQYNNFVGNNVDAQLAPYREVLGALCDAFPNYASIFSEIKNSYDSVIREQAEYIAHLESKKDLESRIERKQRDDISSLQQNVDQLQANLTALQKEMQDREGEYQNSIREGMHQNRGGSGENAEMEEKLERANQRVTDLEKSSRGDLEKILLLIGTVRECDKKIKKLEENIISMSEQLEELAETRRMAGEAQSELEKYKERFQSFVPAKDFELLKEHLGSELTAAQNEARRLRRTAAARSAQVDVLNRKLLQEEEIRMNTPERPLTPRPKWKELEETIPELAEYVKAEHCFPLDEGNEGSPFNEKPAEILSVPGLDTTALRVEFLVDTILSLRSAVDRLEKSSEDSRQSTAKRATVRMSMVNGGARMSVKPISNEQQRFSIKPNAGNKVGFSNRELDGKLFDLPIIGAGVNKETPIYLQISGCVERVIVKPDLQTSIIFNFFSELQQPVMEATSASEVDVGMHFYNFLESEVLTNDDVRSFFSHPAQIAYNFMCDARDPSLTNSSLVLLDKILNGTLPPRVAVDSATLVSHTITDLEALSKEQQKNRLRRAAIAECLFPVLELKTKEDIQELKSVLGNDTTFDTVSLTSITGRFMKTLFEQECYANMKLFTDVVQTISNKARPSKDEEEMDGERDRIIALEEVAKCILEVEPKTPLVIIRELTENAAMQGKDGTLVNDDDKPKSIHLSEVMRVIGIAPILRKTALSSQEDCTF